jgi:integration host factor subunit alpha
MTLTKAELAERLIEKQGLTKRDAKEFVEQFFDQITQLLLESDEMKISGFGKFAKRDKSVRPGRNPKTGEAVEISARRVVTFHVGQKLKKRIESLNEQQG